MLIVALQALAKNIRLGKIVYIVKICYTITMKKAITIPGLRKLNFVAAFLHAAQAAVIIGLSVNFKLPVQSNYLAFNQATQHLEPATATLFSVSIPWIVAGFLLLSAAAHLFIATVYYRKYDRDLKVGINRARWIEYSLSASLMMVAIAMLVGIYDASSLLVIAALVAVMNLCGLVMEIHNQTTKKTSWISFVVGCIAGIMPWIAVAIYFIVAGDHGSKPPAFVYWIYASIFVFFNCFAINMYLQYKKIGPWKNYLFGERTYIILSLVAKSLLAWQVFAGTLQP